MDICNKYYKIKMKFILATILAVSAFVSAFLCVRWLLRYISSHDFTAFAWYRIAFGVVVLITWQFNLVSWTSH